MRRVAIVGAGQSKYGEFPEKGIKELFFDAYKDMSSSVDKNFDPRQIESAYVGNLGSGGFQLGNMSALVAEFVGLPYIHTVRVENACASGGYALVAAIMDVMSGAHKMVIAGGVEKMTDVSGMKQKYWLGVSGDTEYERLAGTTFAGLYALIAHRHMHEFGTTREHLSSVAVKNHRNGAQNPKAQFQREITLEQAMKAPVVAYPLNLFDCCSTTDGASALLVCDEEVAKLLDHLVEGVRVVGGDRQQEQDAPGLHPAVTVNQRRQRQGDDEFKRQGDHAKNECIAQAGPEGIVDQKLAVILQTGIFKFELAGHQAAVNRVNAGIKRDAQQINDGRA